MHTDIRQFEGVRIEHIDQYSWFTIGERNNQIGVFTNMRENSVRQRCSTGIGDGLILPVAQKRA